MPEKMNVRTILAGNGRQVIVHSGSGNSTRLSVLRATAVADGVALDMSPAAVRDLAAALLEVLEKPFVQAEKAG